MIRKLQYVLIWVLPLLLSACEKNGLDDCLKGTGKITKETRMYTSNCIYVRLEGNVNLVLVADSTSALVVEAGENLMDQITTGVINDSLLIQNRNRCNWVRDYSTPVNCFIPQGKICESDYRGSGNITSECPVVRDSICINVRNGSGSITLEVYTLLARLYLHEGTADLNISGKSQVAFIYAADYGPFFCSKFESTHVFINNRGTNDCYVKATYHLGATIEHLGNIYYYGNPLNVDANITGSGQLIKMD